MSDRNGNFLHVDRLAIPTLTPERKHYPALHTSVRMAPAHCAWPGWLDLGDAVAIAYGPSEGYEGAGNPKDAAQKLINKVRFPVLHAFEPRPAEVWKEPRPARGPRCGRRLTARTAHRSPPPHPPITHSRDAQPVMLGPFG